MSLILQRGETPRPSCHSKRLTQFCLARLNYLQAATVEILSVASRPQAAHISEAALIRAAQDRDHNAFEQLVRLHDRNVLRVAMNLLRSKEDARDAYQETFLRAYRRLDSFRFQCAFGTWLYRITTNVCLDLLRRKNVRREHMMSDETPGDGLGLLERAHDERPESDPARVVAGKELADHIDRAIETLSPKERAVFELKHYEGLRLRVIGEILEISEEAAKNCLFRATRKLRRALGETTA